MGLGNGQWVDGFSPSDSGRTVLRKAGGRVMEGRWKAQRGHTELPARPDIALVERQRLYKPRAVRRAVLNPVPGGNALGRAVKRQGAALGFPVGGLEHLAAPADRSVEERTEGPASGRRGCPVGPASRLPEVLDDQVSAFGRLAPGSRSPGQRRRIHPP